MKFEINEEQYYILGDALSEIEENRAYLGRDKEVLDELKDMFDYTKGKEYYK